MKRIKALVARNPSEARGIRKALKAAGIKARFISAKKSKRKRGSRRRSNPEKKPYCQMCGAKRGLKIGLDPKGEKKTLCGLCRKGSAMLRASRKRR